MFTSALVMAQASKAQPPSPVEVKREATSLDSGRGEPQKAVAAAKPDIAKQAAARKPFNVPQLAQRDNLIQELMRQGRPAIRAELIFVRKICGLEKEPFRRINQDAEAALEKEATRWAEAQMLGLIPAQARKGKGAWQPLRSGDSLSSLHEALAAVMKKDLTVDQFALYETEVEKRVVNRKETAVCFLVNAIDHDLYLSDDQRIRLTESLRSHWDESWSMTLEYLLYGSQFHPQGVEPFVTPFLNATQLKVWQGTQKVGGIGGLFGVWGSLMNDNDALEEELGEVKRPAPAQKVRMFQADMMKVQIPTGDSVQQKASVKAASPKK
jgi:hypothetical protein